MCVCVCVGVCVRVCVCVCVCVYVCVRALPPTARSSEAGRVSCALAALHRTGSIRVQILQTALWEPAPVVRLVRRRGLVAYVCLLVSRNALLRVSVRVFAVGGPKLLVCVAPGRYFVCTASAHERPSRRPASLQKVDSRKCVVTKHAFCSPFIAPYTWGSVTSAV